MKVSVIGAGSWGSAIAWLLGEKGIDVCLWARDDALVDSFNATRQNPRYLKDIVFSSTVTASTNLIEVLAATEAVALVTPSAVVEDMAKRIAPHLEEQVPVVLLSKGIEGTTGTLLLDVLAENFIATKQQKQHEQQEQQGQHEQQHPVKPFDPSAQIGASEHFGWPEHFGPHERLAVLSGPNHAEEVAHGIPSGTVVASLSQETAKFFQELFGTPEFRVYTSHDTVGVQLCGATKNIIAIACGMAAGLGLGDNTAAMLMTRGLAEISRLVKQLGGDPRTCMGLAGMGDLIATCTSQHSRNRAFGIEFAQGGTLDAYLKRTHMVVEGALAAKSITDLAKTFSVDLPISTAIRNVVWDQCPITEGLASLIDRSFKPEFY
ncbi:MAG: NAD(P)-dependent glycerol-3-phosphate dehydrogenase [Coriobacteriales bacterium]|jgi:glycerol-3-phosphate dehydrogenase (NAD(P)+)|nr:NAD(P)-dependent glycerol-3-phosphate dehydrogenase [Coriobacteriales bacterium]